MAISRKLTRVIVVVVAILAVMATFCLVTWMTAPVTIDLQQIPLLITDVQFDKNYLNITVENIGTRLLIIS